MQVSTDIPCEATVKKKHVIMRKLGDCVVHLESNQLSAHLSLLLMHSGGSYKYQGDRISLGECTFCQFVGFKVHAIYRGQFCMGKYVGL